ncbi:hypothetical protein CFT13S00388_02640 [Campylobacter fetus subsp. testudinum]|uniref:hypothetical protein n=1 Tax=Campylobacter fetus TaxID=196 RepID=UPI000818AA37|nr:hypothetical protein [Campylobacter fetus]OCR88082.1 hypothetical protein CFT13S00388_02640 [Campylobacter fetus subsp. testudinum]
MFNTGFTGHFSDILECEMDFNLYKIAKEVIIDKIDKEDLIRENYKKSQNVDQEVELELVYAKNYWSQKKIKEYSHFNTVEACKELSNLQNTLKTYLDMSNSKYDIYNIMHINSALSYIDLVKDSVIEINLPEESNHKIVLEYVRNIIKEFKESDSEVLLGIMLKKAGEYVNLTHPIALSNYIEKDKNNIWNITNKTSKLYVYYTTKEKALDFTTDEKDLLDLALRKKLEETNYLENTLGDAIALYKSRLTSPQIIKFKRDNLEDIPESIISTQAVSSPLNYPLNIYCNKIFLDINESIPASITSYLIPIDRIATNLIFPYYGNVVTTLTQKNYNFDYNIRGINLSPMLSCNLSNDVESPLVCTGEFKSNTIEGLETLCIANLNSPYHKVGGTYRTLDWITMNIDVSYNIIDEEIGVNSDNRTI